MNGYAREPSQEKPAKPEEALPQKRLTLNLPLACIPRSRGFASAKE